AAAGRRGAGARRAGPRPARGLPRGLRRARTPTHRLGREAMLVRILLGLICLCRAGISPRLPPACRFIPACSPYVEEAVRRYGVGRGPWRALWRLLRFALPACRGYDPVDGLD